MILAYIVSLVQKYRWYLTLLPCLPSQTSEWLNRAQGLNGPSNDDYLFNIEGLFAAQNSIVCSCVLISMLNISLITQLGVSLADSWPSSKPASTSTDVGVQMSNSV